MQTGAAHRIGPEVGCFLQNFLGILTVKNVAIALHSRPSSDIDSGYCSERAMKEGRESAVTGATEKPSQEEHNGTQGVLEAVGLCRNGSSRALRVDRRRGAGDQRCRHESVLVLGRHGHHGARREPGRVQHQHLGGERVRAAGNHEHGVAAGLHHHQQAPTGSQFPADGERNGDEHQPADRRLQAQPQGGLVRRHADHGGRLHLQLAGPERQPGLHRRRRPALRRRLDRRLQPDRSPSSAPTPPAERPAIPAVRPTATSACARTAAPSR